MDIIIPLGKGSHCNDLELLYCLRSIEKYLSGYSDIYIIGEWPEFVNWDKVNHIPAKDEIRAGIRDWNICKKIRIACDNIYISDDFFFMNDDHFFLKPVNVNDFPFYHGGPLLDRIAELTDAYPYRKTITNTFNYLKSIGVKGIINDYDVHCPIIYNKIQFIKTVPGDFPYAGYAIKSMYCNQHPVPGEFMNDLKVSEPFTERGIRELFMNREWFSIGDRTLKSGDMKKFLQQVYPHKSKFEK